MVDLNDEMKRKFYFKKNYLSFNKVQILNKFSFTHKWIDIGDNGKYWNYSQMGRNWRMNIVHEYQSHFTL